MVVLAGAGELRRISKDVNFALSGGSARSFPSLSTTGSFSIAGSIVAEHCTRPVSRRCPPPAAVNQASPVITDRSGPKSSSVSNSAGSRAGDDPHHPTISPTSVGTPTADGGRLGNMSPWASYFERLVRHQGDGDFRHHAALGSGIHRPPSGSRAWAVPWGRYEKADPPTCSCGPPRSPLSRGHGSAACGPRSPSVPMGGPRQGEDRQRIDQRHGMDEMLCPASGRLDPIVELTRNEKGTSSNKG